MNTTDHPENHSGQGHPSDHESIADDRFVHGLLELLHKDTAESRRSRINAALNRIEAENGPPRAHRRRLLTRFIPLTTAAALTVAVISTLVITSQSAANAMIGEAIRATQRAPQLRYEIRVSDPNLQTDLQTNLQNDQQTDQARGQERVIGTVDMRGPFLLVQIDTPHGHTFTLGRDDEGEWSIRKDGSVERLDPRAAAPRWINLGESTILVGGLDALLDKLRDDDYSIEQAQNSQASSSGQPLTQLVATRRPETTKPGPDRVLVWINSDSSLVERLELHWDRDPSAKPHLAPPRPSNRDSGTRGPQPPPPLGEQPMHRGGPELIRDFPRFRVRHHPPPPELIVFQRTESNSLSDEAFSPPAP